MIQIHHPPTYTLTFIAVQYVHTHADAEHTDTNIIGNVSHGSDRDYNVDGGGNELIRMISDAATRVVLIRIESIGPQRRAVIAPVTTRDRNRLTQAKDGRRLQYRLLRGNGKTVRGHRAAM